VVSPAVVEMGGVLVCPRKIDFLRLDATLVEQIFGEVSLDHETAEHAIEAME